MRDILWSGKRPVSMIPSCRHPRPALRFMLAAGLLARGSNAPAPFPVDGPVASGEALAAYSCEGSHGIGP